MSEWTHGAPYQDDIGKYRGPYGAKHRTFDTNFAIIEGLLYPPTMINQGQIWHTKVDPRCTYMPNFI